MKRRVDFHIFLQAVNAVDHDFRNSPAQKEEWISCLVDEWVAYAKDTSAYDIKKGYMAPAHTPPMRDLEA